jgi:hypothetical protein
MCLARMRLFFLGVAGVCVACLAIARWANKEPPPKSIPANYNPALIRTDFSDGDAWQAIRAAVMEIPSDLRDGIEAMKAMNSAGGADISGYDRPVEFVSVIDDSRYANRTTEEVLELVT